MVFVCFCAADDDDDYHDDDRDEDETMMMLMVMLKRGKIWFLCLCVSVVAEWAIWEL